MKYIYDLHKTMLGKDLILVYEGEFTQEITKSVLSMAERNMDAYGEESRTKRKVFNVMVETLQNITRHAELNAIFMIAKQDDAYLITSGNPVLNEEVENISKKLAFINELDKQGLKEHYKQVIRNTELSPKGGAGLGFIDMAKKTGEKLCFDFEPIDDSFTFFSLKTTVPRNKVK
ncbi:SiaB family protein kinase [Algivirga pacifica]|uniref:SiaB family protein kinase n=1 Tax=Algivirga pacifica TaxID=1162670 RepID=A0ABP9DBN8_9BACT